MHVPGCLDSSRTCSLENLFKTEKEKFVIFHCKTSELYICLLKSTVYFLPCSARDLYLSNVNCFLCIWWVYIVYNSKILHLLFGVHLFLEYQYSAVNTMIWWIILKESIELAQSVTERVLWRADWRHQVWQVLTLSLLRSPYQLSTLFKIPVHLW